MAVHIHHIIITMLCALLLPAASVAQSLTVAAEANEALLPVPEWSVTETLIEIEPLPVSESPLLSIYAFPMSHFTRHEDWHRMWINTAVLSGCFVGALVVLQCLPEDATAWNKHELTSVPLFKRWYNHVIKDGPVWDHDKPFINFVLHPYSGAVYFMSARSCGFNFWGSLLYSALISSVEWEFGIEAFMEKPSFNDLLLTPIIGSVIGEGFYMAKHHIVNNGYRLLGSPILGNAAVFLMDPVNEVIGLFAGNPARRWAKARVNSSPGAIMTADGAVGYGLRASITF